MDKQAAWTAYWNGPAAQAGGGCVPGRIAPLEALQEKLWGEVARSLRKGAAVLDLATGDGAVLRRLRRGRPDLKLTGVDAAASLPKAAGMVLRPGIGMEALPFRAGAFDLVTSQFGIEYGDVAKAAGEAARVLHDGRRFGFLVHHSDGAIVRHNRARLAALEWATVESGILDKARNVARGRALALLPTPPAFAEIVRDAARRFPGQSAAAEFTEAVRRCLDGGARAALHETLRALEELEQMAEGEKLRLSALLEAALDERGVTQLAGTLDRAGLAPTVRAPVGNGGGQPLAWWVAGSKA